MELQQSHYTHDCMIDCCNYTTRSCLSAIIRKCFRLYPPPPVLLPPAYLPLALAFYFVYTKWGAQIIMDMDTFQENHVLNKSSKLDCATCNNHTYNILKYYNFTKGAFTLDVYVNSSFEYPNTMLLI